MRLIEGHLHAVRVVIEWMSASEMEHVSVCRRTDSRNIIHVLSKSRVYVALSIWYLSLVYEFATLGFTFAHQWHMRIEKGLTLYSKRILILGERALIFEEFCAAKIIALDCDVISNVRLVLILAYLSSSAAHIAPIHHTIACFHTWYLLIIVCLIIHLWKLRIKILGLLQV